MTSVKRVPSDTELLEKTLEDPINDVDIIGECTDSLSDISEEEEDGELLFRTRHPYFSTWLKRLRPLVRNKNVRVVSITNLVFLLINTVLLMLLIALFVYTLVQLIMARNSSAVDKPCLFKWSEWSDCSDPCSKNASHLPTKTRKVLCNTIVRARGKYTKTAPCPKNVRTMVDKAPCNTHRCPKKLSEIDWRRDKSGHDITTPIDVKNPKKCYRIRDIPLGDFLIEIDTHVLTEEVDCRLPRN